MRVVLAAGLVGYVADALRRAIWARRTERQLGLEQQFVCHGPSPENVRPCLRRRNHLWTSSLALKGLKTLAFQPRGLEAATGFGRNHLGRAFLQALESVQPGRVPPGLLWASGVGLFWVLSISSGQPGPPTVEVWIGGALMLAVLMAEVIAAVLRSDVRDGVRQFAGLLGEWTERRTLDEVIVRSHSKGYRHTALYRPSPFSLLDRKEPRAVPAFLERG